MDFVCSMVVLRGYPAYIVMSHDVERCVICIISSCLFGSISAAVTAGNPEHDSSNLVSLESGLKHGVILYNEAEVFSLSIGSFSNDDGDGKTTVKNDFIFFLRMSQLCKSAQYAYRSKNLRRLYMHPQRSILKEDTKN